MLLNRETGESQVIGVAGAVFGFLDVFTIDWGLPAIQIPTSINLQTITEVALSLLVIFSQALKTRGKFNPTLAKALPIGVGMYGIGEFMSWNQTNQTVAAGLNLFGYVWLASSVVLVIFGYLAADTARVKT